MKSVPAFDIKRVFSNPLIGSRTPEFGADSACGERDLGIASALIHRAGKHDRCFRLATFWSVGPLVKATHNVGIGDVVRTGRHDLVFVVRGQVIEDTFAGTVRAAVHALKAVLNDCCEFVGKRRVVHLACGHGRREHKTVSVLMLKTFTKQRCASCGRADDETFGLGVGSGPHQIAYPLESEHRIQGEERNHWNAACCITRSGSSEARQRSGFGDSFFKELPTFGFHIGDQQLVVDRFIELTLRGVNAKFAEQNLHAEGPCFVGNDRYDARPKVF